MEKFRKLNNSLLPDETKAHIKKYFRVNFNFSLVCISASLLLCLFYVFFPATVLNVKFINFAGMLFIKLSFVWLVIAGFQVSGTLNSLYEGIPVIKLFKMELVLLIGVGLLSAGTLMFIPGTGTLLLFLFFVFSAVIFRKNYRSLKKNINPDQTTAA